MMYDDIAQNPENPNKGVVINKPNGPNVYQNIKIDYTGAQVTPDNFLKVLKGDSSAGGPVLKSTAQDNVFVNFVDHGGPGIIAFPSDLLKASDLIAALQYMHTNNMYKSLLFYLEACESGSMFENLLPANINIYATTAADATHSSYACYYDQQLNTYLGDVYSVNWMEDSDLGRLASETVAQQFVKVKAETNTSVVCEFGSLGLKTDTLNDFQAGDGPDAAAKPLIGVPARRTPITDAVDSRQVEVARLRHRVAQAATPAERAQAQAALAAEEAKRAATHSQFLSIVGRVAGVERALFHMKNRVSLDDYRCVEEATQAFHDRCLNLGQDSWALEHTMAFASLCKEGVAAATIVGAIEAECTFKTVKLAAQPVLNLHFN